ncbi:YfmQ family protein [Ureibacillus sp. NPDC094379]
MTWTVALVVLGGILLKLLTSPPSAVVGWVVSKFALHPKIDSSYITVTYNGMQLEKEDQDQLVEYFNEALFLERYHIFPGTEEMVLHPETDVIPYIITVKKRKKEVKFSVYNYDDHVDIVKQRKKKVAFYRLTSDELQNFTISHG